MSAFGDRRLAASAGAALLVANLRFWPRIAPLVTKQLSRWEQKAHAIKAPTLNALALQKLREEHFNAQVAATLATTAPAEHRHAVIEAIVAYEVIYDYLDGLTEQPSIPSLAHAQRAYHAFTDAIKPNSETPGDYYTGLGLTDSGYLAQLVTTTQDALITLPSWPAVTDTAIAAARRCAEAQARAHTTATASLQTWAQRQARQTQVAWREFLAGAASSVLAVHALIATAAQPHVTHREAACIDSTYLSICAISTLLDGLVDYDRDLQAGQVGYLSHYHDSQQIAHGLADAAQHAIDHARDLPHPGHHLMTLVGVAAYYMSAPTANTEPARTITRELHHKLSPLITPTLTIMRAWRAAKRATRRAGK